MTTKDHESDINDFITMSENRAWAILTSFDGNGWVVPVTLSVSTVSYTHLTLPTICSV